jgi:hypothetical protein
MRASRPGAFAALLSAALAACAQLAPPEIAPQPAHAQPALPGRGAAVAAREDLSGHFIALTGPKRPHAPPFLDVAGTNFYCLRSFIDRRTGVIEHQLYVSDSYSGAERNWNAARDGSGEPLRFVPISRDEISCAAACSYAEEFAASIPESTLRASLGGLDVTFTASSGESKTIHLSSDQIAAQLAAVGARRHPGSPPPA